MKNLIWIVVLFAAAVGIALLANAYPGNVYIVTGQAMMRVNLHAFAVGVVVLVVVLYTLFALLNSILNIPSGFRRFNAGRRRNKANKNLNAAGLAYFEGKFQKAEQEAAKVLGNKEAGSHRTLALMLGAHAADQMDNTELRDRYLNDIATLPEKMQLSRHLLLAESALGRCDYTVARENIEAAAKINPKLTRLTKLQLRYAFDHGDALEVLAYTDKLQRAAVLSESEAAQYREWAFRHLLSLATDSDSMKACLKRIPESDKADKLCVAIAEKYTRLGLYAAAVNWVCKYYPQTHYADLLPALVQSIGYLNEKAQRKTIDTADSWLKKRPDDADLLMYLGQLAYAKQLWGKAQGYLEASLSVQPSVQAYLALAKVFDAVNEPEKAADQRRQALDDATREEEQALEALGQTLQ